MNLVVLTGRLTKECDLTVTQSGKSVTKLSLAVADSFNKDKVDFINCVAWNKTAEIMAQYLKKGSKIGVQGKMQTGCYEKEGKKIYTTEIVIDNFEFLDSKKKD